MKKYIGFFIVLGVFVFGALYTQNVFASCTGDTSSVTVLSPNGGEVYTQGQEVEVSWSSCNLSETDSIMIGYGYSGPGSHEPINVLPLSDHNVIVPNTHHTIVTMPVLPNPVPALREGKYYKIYIAYFDTNNSSIITSDWSDNLFTINSTTSNDNTPRIMYWYGKVNQHFDLASSSWATDPDGVSGADLNKLTYCKKWYPNTTSVQEYKEETINTWRRAKQYEQSGYTSTKMSYKCVQGGTITPASITVLSPNGGETWVKGTEQKIKWQDNSTYTCPVGTTCNPTSKYYDIRISRVCTPGENCPQTILPLSYTIANKVTGDYYLWDVGKVKDTSVPFSVSDGSYIVLVCDAGLNKCDESDSSFKIVSSTTTCPVGCTCNGEAVTCPVVDDACLLGYIYSPNTGKLCPNIDSNDGCLPGYKYSPKTGQKCLIAIKTCSSNSEVGCGNPNSKIKRILKVGTKGEDVKILQSLLGVTADGSFGPMTKAKVIEWQAQNGLKADGLFGSQSAAKAGLSN